MSLEDLPVLTGLTALSLGHAVLHLEDGSSVTVGTEPHIWLPSVPPFVLTALDGQHRLWYGVPDHLYATVCAALGLYRFGEPLPCLTLTGIDQQPDAVTFQAVNGEGQAVALSVPRPVFTRLEFVMPPLPQQVSVIVTCEDAMRGRGFRFEIQHETPEGRAVLELLGYADRVSLTLEGVRPSRFLEAAD